MSQSLFAIKVVATLLVALSLQGVLSYIWRPFRYIDLALIVTVYFSLMRNQMMGMFIGMASGVIKDALPGSGGIIGIGGIAKTLIGFFVATASVHLTLENSFVRLLVVAIASVINTAIYVGLYALLGVNLTPEQGMQEIIKKAEWELIANTGAAIVIFWLLNIVFAEERPDRYKVVKRRFYR